MLGRIPYAAAGSGEPLILLAGLSIRTGVARDAAVHGSLAPVRGLLPRRRVLVTNRWPDMPADLTMDELARVHADAIRAAFGGPVDVLGVSTGGSIAQQLAAQHPDAVRNLVLVSTGHTLGERARREQAEVAVALRDGHADEAAAAALTALAPDRLAELLDRPVRMIGGALSRLLLPTEQIRSDLEVTLFAEDDFDLSTLPAIRARTLIVGGGRDDFYSPADFRRTAELIPGSVLRILPRRGHVTVQSDPRAQATIAGFLAPRAAGLRV